MPVAHSDSYQTTLFRGSQPPSTPAAPTRRISARRAYQEALHSYGLLIDIRPVWQRQLAGEIDPRLNTVSLSVGDLDWLAGAAGGLRPILLCQLGNASVRLAAALSRVGVRDVTDVIDGFVGWQTAGLPLRQNH